MQSFKSNNKSHITDYINPSQMPLTKDEKTINWKKHLYLLLKNWYWFLITIGLALGVAFFKLNYSIPQYEASAKLIIEENETSQDVLNELRSIRYWRRQADLANERAKLSSFTSVKRAVDSLQQNIFWTAHGRIRKRPIYINPRYLYTCQYDSSNYSINKEWFIDYIDQEKFRIYLKEEIDTIFPLDSNVMLNDWCFSINLKPKGSGHYTYSFVVNDPVTLTKQYINKLDIETDQNQGSVLTLKTAGVVGEREVDFLNTLCQTYIISGLERKQLIAENTSIFIDEQITVILDSLNKSEEHLLAFRLTNNVIDLSRVGEIAYDRLKNFQEQKTRLKLKENYYNYLLDYINKRNDPQTIIAPSIAEVGDQILISTLQEMQGLYQERENLDFTALKNNPSLDNIDDRIKGLRNRLLEIVNGLIENTRLLLEQVEIEEKEIYNQLKTLPPSEQQLLNIKRKYDLYNQFYTFLLEKRAEAGIQKASTISNVRILDPSRIDQLIPVGNDKNTMLFMALLIGFLTPLSIIFFNSLLDNRIKDRSDIENKTDIPIIGIIGHAQNTDVLPVLENPKSEFSEALRRIRANLSFILRKKENSTIMVTSSVSGEGKTFTAANLAAILALNNKKVLLIGCDLRKPALHKVFGISNEKGITSYIVGEENLQNIVFSTAVENLSVMPSGPIPPNPAELLETQEFGKLFSWAKKEFDYLIIDTPPIALVADALSLSQYTDLTIYIIRQYHSHVGVLDVINSAINEDTFPSTYLLINDIKPSRTLGVNYYYGYARGYGYSYYSDSKGYYSSESI